MEYKKSIHDGIMAFLHDYLSETPTDIVQQEIAAISKLEFTGTSARDYFLDYHKHYLGVEIPVNVVSSKVEGKLRNERLKFAKESLKRKVRGFYKSEKAYSFNLVEKTFPSILVEYGWSKINKSYNNIQNKKYEYV